MQLPLEPQQQLRLACRSGDVARVSELFAYESLSTDDSTFALEKVLYPKHEVIRVLLQNGADAGVIGVRSIPWSRRPTELLRLLAEYGYDFKPDGHLILQDFAHDRETIDWLLDQGVDISQTDTRRLDDGFNLASEASDNSLHLLNKVAADGDIDLFDYLVSRGADASRSLALHTASKFQDPEKSRAMVRNLLDRHNMDINVNDRTFRDTFNGVFDQGSPLCSAVIHRNLAVVQELLNRGASSSKPGFRPVSYAVKSGGFLPALEPLLRAGADPTKALIMSVRCTNLEAAEACLEFGADPASALVDAIEDEKERVEIAADNAAFYEDQSYEEDEASIEERKAAEKSSRSFIDFLTRATESSTASHSTGFR